MDVYSVSYNITDGVVTPAEEGGSNTLLPSSVLYSILYAALILAVISGNTLVLLAVYFEKSLRTTTNFFIVNLACADLLLGTLVLPFSGVFEAVGEWHFGHVFCDVWAATDVLCCTASINSLCIISIDRYIGVSRPLKHKLIMTPRRAGWLIVLVWVVSFSIAVGPLFGWRPVKDNPFDCPLSNQVDYVFFSVSGSFYIPTLVIIILYIKIYRAVSRESRKLKPSRDDENHKEVSLRIHRGAENNSFSSQSQQSSSSESHSLRKNRLPRQLSQKRAITFNREKKVAKTLGIVVGAFILCWFPFFFLLPLICPDCNIPPGFFTFAFWLGYCNSFVNPIIYGASNRTFRRAFRGILSCQYCFNRWRRLTSVNSVRRMQNTHSSQH
ncbi:Alpha-1A adrenergic receptor [Holothuria leucospilota]|uniref:Alpha-1A adrenergic receptor n=1 Tax=Holothuria leucospilota TaxID=206669 RepID=A0A9Q0YRI2_HOLLE|nr:Alpha-1A adrenergic receptor [Holothuria leucospilota]